MPLSLAIMCGCDRELPQRARDGGGDGIVAAAGAQRRHRRLRSREWSGRCSLRCRLGCAAIGLAMDGMVTPDRTQLELFRLA